MHSEQDAAKIEEIVRINTASVSNELGQARRAQHPKQHGIAAARLTVEAVPEDLRHGLFARQATYDCFVRFSNGRRVDDRRDDAHGMAIKVLRADGAEAVQDFVLVDSESFFTGDLGQYLAVNKAFAGSSLLRRLGALLRLLTDRALLGRARRFASKQIRSPLETPYFSTTPYRLGPDRVVKWAALPEPSEMTAEEAKLRIANEEAQAAMTRDGLSEALRSGLGAGPVNFGLFADVQTDAGRQPIEDPAVVWSAMRGARRERLATLRLIETDSLRLHPGAPLAENLAFSPWHALEAHEPLGAINHARRETYAAGVKKRHEVNKLSLVGDPGAPVNYASHQIAAPKPPGGMGGAVLLTAVLIFAGCLYLEFIRLTTKPGPPRTFDDPVAEFKYGSIGAEWSGFPHAVWRELPTIFADRIPEGWSSFGFIEEPGAEVPVGISVRRLGVPRVGFNCATCHSAEMIVGDRALTVLGAPAAQLDIQAYLQFLVEVAQSERLTAEAVIESAAANGRPFGALGRAMVHRILVPQIHEQAEGLAAAFAWMQTKPRHGPGRTDAGNSWRARWGLAPEEDDAIGTVDFPSVWNQRIRHGGWFHWDGNNGSLQERNYSAALAGGAKEWLLQRELIDAQSDWLDDLPPPRLPLPRDEELYEAGAEIYSREGCGTCHDPGGATYGKVTPLSDLGTDPARTDLFDEDFVERFGYVGEGYSWRFTHYRATDGYANAPLDGIWARAPYLHNGSVPTLEALLSPPAERPATFLTGCRTFDPVAVGYACRKGFVFDTSLPGNSNSGHLYGTDLTADDKAALIEYLKYIDYSDQ